MEELEPGGCFDVFSSELLHVGWWLVYGAS